MASLTAGVLASVLTFTNPFSPGARTGFPFRDFPQLSSFHISLIHNLFELWYLIGYLTGSPIPIDIKPQPQPMKKYNQESKMSSRYLLCVVTSLLFTSV